MKILKEFGRNPHLDWITILVVTTLLILGLAFAGYSLYNAVVTGSIEGDSPSSTLYKKVNEKPIAVVLRLFESKAATSTQMRAGYTGAPDPSI